MTERLLPKNAGVVDEELRREVVGAVENKVVVLDDIHDIVRHEIVVVGDDVDVRIDSPHSLCGRVNLGLSNVGRRVDYLPLQVGKVHIVGINNADGANAGRSKIQSRRGSQAARSNNEHLAVQDLFLALDADLF